MQTGRRAVLGLAASALMLGRGAWAADAPSIAVVGAGMAGLAAARSLTEAGARVSVFEARDRIGGRVWTSHLWPDLPVDMGASWIHGVRKNPLTDLADRIGATRIATSYDSAVALRPGGAEANAPEPWEIVEAAQNLAWKAAADLSLRDAVMATKAWARATLDQRAAIRQAVHRAVEQEYAADWSQLSARAFDDAKQFGGGDVLFAQGFGQLADHAARGLDIRLSHPVVTVARTGSGIRLGLADGTGAEFDAGIVTVPLGVLQAGALRFDPALPASHRSAIDGLGMGQFVKCWLRFAAPLPLPAVDWIEVIEPPHPENPDGQTPLWAEWVNLQPGLGQPVVLGFAAGHAARVAEAMGTQAAITSALETLQRVVTRPLPDLLGAQISGWGRDALALGAYSFARPGSDATTRDRLAAPLWDGRLHLAGEAASPDHPSTVHGAWLSGIRAARAVLR